MTVVSGPTFSHHLKTLRETGLITGERRGTWVYHRVNPTLLAQIFQVIATPATTP